MYLWTAIDVSPQLAALRGKVEAISAEQGISNAALTLPLHISLRISFPVEDALEREITGRLQSYLKSLRPFAVQVEGVERAGGIVWLRIRENDRLRAIHASLVGLLEREYGVQAQKFDLDFQYHVSLLTGETPAAARRFSEALGEPSVPQTLEVNRLVIGASKTGRAGDYRVTQTICI